jgi:hypothetical protein
VRDAQGDAELEAARRGQDARVVGERATPDEESRPDHAAAHETPGDSEEHASA